MLTKLYVKAQSMFVREEGAAGVEYGILVAAIAALIVAVAFLIGGKIQTAFNTVNNAIP